MSNIFNLKIYLFLLVLMLVQTSAWMSIALPNQTFVGKPFKILHSDLNSLSTGCF